MRIPKGYIKFLLLFLSIYAGLYYGTYAFIGLSTKGGKYIEWLQYVDYVTFYRNILLHSSAKVLVWLGYYTQFRGKYLLYINGAVGIQLVYWCLGIGILSFWNAYVIAFTKDSFRFRLKWMLIGVLFVTTLNILRIVLLLISYYEIGVTSFGIDHHELYNIVLYVLVFVLMIMHRKRQQKESH